jgi:acyl dehydratase
MNSLSIDKLEIGQEAVHTKTICLDDIEKFADIIGDHNPAHMDDDYAKKTPFEGRIAHGMLVGALFSTIFGVLLPGLGSIYTKQSLKFTKPVYPGDTITAKVIVKELIIERNRVVFDCLATNQKGETVIIGEAEIMPPKTEVKL